MLFLTENYAALDILKHYLSGVDSSATLNTADVRQETMEPFVLFGSSFPKDKEYTQVSNEIMWIIDRACSWNLSSVIVGLQKHQSD